MHVHREGNSVPCGEPEAHLKLTKYFLTAVTWYTGLCGSISEFLSGESTQRRRKSCWERKLEVLKAEGREVAAQGIMA